MSGRHTPVLRIPENLRGLLIAFGNNSGSCCAHQTRHILYRKVSGEGGCTIWCRSLFQRGAGPFFFFFFEVSSCFGLAQTLPFSLSPFEMREGCCYSLLQLNCTLGFFLPFTPRGASSLWLANAIGRLGRSLSCVGKTQKGTTKKNWA